MNTRARNAVLVGLLLAACLGGAYTYARYEMEDRLLDFSPAVDRIGYDRGGRIPTTEDFTARTRAEAESLGLEVVSLEVTRSDATRTEDRQLDATGRLAQERIGALGQLRMRLVSFDVRATLIARRWFLSRTAEVSVQRTYREEVELHTPGERPLPAPVDELVPRGM
ncbi:MAG: hypothetical protein H6719_07235 [Sandaracinaceae bacterium]|nr:hypothetical protein [Sandaracinaceae bacterium]